MRRSSSDVAEAVVARASLGELLGELLGALLGGERLSRRAGDGVVLIFVVGAFVVGAALGELLGAFVGVAVGVLSVAMRGRRGRCRSRHNAACVARRPDCTGLAGTRAAIPRKEKAGGSLWRGEKQKGSGHGRRESFE
jgi:hypothetical protein